MRFFWRGTFEKAAEAYGRRDFDTALRLCRPLAEKGHSGAQYQLGAMYYDGEGVMQNYSEALKWLRMAGDQGDSKAQFYLGSAYRNGKGVPQDDAEAVKWFRKAADQGNASAQGSLGAMYVQGLGVPQDGAEAAKWLRKAADQGNADAQYLIGLMYAKGAGVPKNRVKAIEWFRKATDNGNVEAKKTLAEVTSKLADGPVTIKPDLTKRPANITLRELVEALIIYLYQINGIHVHSFYFDVNEFCWTDVYLTSFVDGYEKMSFMIEDKRLRSENGKIGSHSMIVIIHAGDRGVVFSFVAVPNADRSITFHKVKRFDNKGVAYY